MGQGHRFCYRRAAKPPRKPSVQSSPRHDITRGLRPLLPGSKFFRPLAQRLRRVRKYLCWVWQRARRAFPKPERDWYWDVGAVYRVTPHLVYQHDDYFRLDRDYLDYGYFGYVPIDIPFNFSHGYGWGTENS